MAWVETASGIALPTPAFDSGKVTITTVVDGGRNANNVFIGSVVGDDKLKIEMRFPALKPEEMQNFLRIFDRKRGGHFVNTFRVFDPRVNDYVYMDMYVSDRTGRPLLVDKNTGRPTYWQDVSASLVEC